MPPSVCATLVRLLEAKQQPKLMHEQTRFDVHKEQTLVLIMSTLLKISLLSHGKVPECQLKNHTSVQQRLFDISRNTIVYVHRMHTCSNVHAGRPVMVNGAAVSKTTLVEGSSIELGATIVRYRERNKKEVSASIVRR
jgi:hypothetical protein